MNIDITQIVIALIGLAGLITTSVLVPWIKSKMTNEQWATLKAISLDAVEAAEIFYKGSGQGLLKKEAAKKFIEEQCALRGIKVDMNAIDASVESAWKQLGLDKK